MADQHALALSGDLFGPELHAGLMHALVVTRDAIARASVPLLSLVSGFLLARRARQRTYAEVATSRLVTVGLPMITWVGIFCAVFTAFNFLGIPSWTYGTIAKGTFFTHLATLDFTVAPHLNFLRDLLVCSLPIPIMLLAIRRWPVVFALVIAAIALAVDTRPVLQRPMILVFFVAGVYLQVYRGHLSVPKPVAMIAIAIAGTYALTALFNVNPIFLFPPPSGEGLVIQRALDLTRRLIMSSAFWVVAGLFVGTSLYRYFRYFERTIFLTYLGHPLVVFVAWRAWDKIIGHGDLAIVAYFALPIVILLLTPAAAWFIKWLPRPAQIAIAGRPYDRFGVHPESVSRSPAGSAFPVARVRASASPP